jgi:hypothetical protein
MCISFISLFFIDLLLITFFLDMFVCLLPAILLFRHVYIDVHLEDKQIMLLFCSSNETTYLRCDGTPSGLVNEVV